MCPGARRVRWFLRRARAAQPLSAILPASQHLEDLMDRMDRRNPRRDGKRRFLRFRVSRQAQDHSGIVASMVSRRPRPMCSYLACGTGEARNPRTGP